jgi:hypothetical protein
VTKQHKHAWTRRSELGGGETITVFRKCSTKRGMMSAERLLDSPPRAPAVNSPAAPLFAASCSGPPAAARLVALSAPRSETFPAVRLLTLPSAVARSPAKRPPQTTRTPLTPRPHRAFQGRFALPGLRVGRTAPPSERGVLCSTGRAVASCPKRRGIRRLKIWGKDREPNPRAFSVFAHELQPPFRKPSLQISYWN